MTETNARKHQTFTCKIILKNEDQEEDNENRKNNKNKTEPQQRRR